MKIYNYLIKDHRKVSALFKKILSAKTNPIREKLQDKIIVELLVHATSEQNTFYKKLKQYDKSKEVADHGVDEHNDIKKNINKLVKQEIGTTAWRKSITQLKKTVDHHVHEEEGKMFNKARQVLTPLQENALTTQMITAKKRIKKSLTIVHAKPASQKRSTLKTAKRTNHQRRVQARKKAGVQRKTAVR